MEKEKEALMKEDKEATYYQSHSEQMKANNKRWVSTPGGYYRKLLNNAIKRHHNFNINKEEYVKWFISQPRVCCYCGVALVRGGDRRTCLSIDRKDNEKDYSIDNITMCCLSCNSVKSNVFTYNEMVEIGRKYIAPKKGVTFND